AHHRGHHHQRVQRAQARNPQANPALILSCLHDYSSIIMANPRIPYRFSDHRPALVPPEAGRIIVHLVVNVENWRFDHAMPRHIITPPHGKEALPDVPNFSWADYGMRAGLPRILRALAERGLPASTSFNASVIDAYPEAAEAMREAGWEFIGHGMH